MIHNPESLHLQTCWYCWHNSIC